MTQTKTTMFTNEMSYNEDTIELWKTQTHRRKVIYMSNNKGTVGSLEYTHMKNADHRSSTEHYKGHGIHICKTQKEER